MGDFLLIVLGVFTGAFLTILLFFVCKWPFRRAVQALVTSLARRLSMDPYAENLLEIGVSFGRTPPLLMQENSLRAQRGTVIQRPLGSNKRFPSLSELMFNSAQLHTLPTPVAVPVDQRVTIGPAAAKPLSLALPLMVSGMAFGEALSRAVVIALARGVTLAGTALHAGEVPLHPGVRTAAEKLILQYHRGH